MAMLLASVGVLLGSGLLALAAGRWPRRCTTLGVAGAVAGGGIGIVPALEILAGGPVQVVRLPWQVPYGSFHVELDALSAWFVLVVLVVCSLAAVYGGEYLRSYEGKKPLGPAWFFFNLLTASMVLVLIARNAVLFLSAWEVMAVSSFFLITFDDERESVRRAGWTYLVATHLGTAFLLVLFVLLGREAGSLDFAAIAASGAPASTGLLFVLAVIGFGAKAGFVPLHVWLPEAHPAAPSHVSAVLSGVMIKTGIYGLLRVSTYLGPPSPWWGWLLIGIGLASGLFGILLALCQGDLKRLLAYSSVENIGIITLGLGVGLLGRSLDLPVLAALGLAGSLLHVANHALFKGLLFLAAGAVLHGTGTVALEQLGGLMKRMPLLGGLFLVGAVAVCGLPPLNGFASEFLIYLSAYRGSVKSSVLAALPLLAVIGGLALIGGLAAACFTRAFGIVFLGQPRSEHARHVHPPGLAMRWPMLVLAAGCLLVGVLAPWIVMRMGAVVEELAGLGGPRLARELAGAGGTLESVTVSFAILAALVLAVALLRWRLLRGRQVTESETWGCGYARPTPRMQYTASSFAQPLTSLFQPLLRTRLRQPVVDDYFPAEQELATETPEVWQEVFYRPFFRVLARGALWFRWLQLGRVQIYVLYIALTILALLVWYLGLAT